MLACRSRWIEGSATFTTVLSSMIMNSAKHIAASVHHLRLSSFRRIRSGMARHDRFQGVRERRALRWLEGGHQFGNALDTKLGQPPDQLVRLGSGADGLGAAVVGALDARHEAALQEAVHR